MRNAGSRTSAGRLPYAGSCTSKVTISSLARRADTRGRGWYSGPSRRRELRMRDGGVGPHRPKTKNAMFRKQKRATGATHATKLVSELRNSQPQSVSRFCVFGGQGFFGLTKKAKNRLSGWMQMWSVRRLDLWSVRRPRKRLTKSVVEAPGKRGSGC